MKEKIFNILIAIAVVMPSFTSDLALANEAEYIKAADVVILVDFSGSITNDPRYPEAEKNAIKNLVNVSWPTGSRLAIVAFGAADSRNGGKPSTFPMCNSDFGILRSTENIETWIDECTLLIGTSPVGPMTDHNKAIKKAVEILSAGDSVNNSKFVLLMTDGKLDVDNNNPVNPDYVGTGEEKDRQAIDELFLEVLPDARAKGIQIWPVGFGDVNRIELNGYAPEGGQPGPDSCQLEIPKAVIAEPEDLPYEINKIIRQVTCLGEYVQGDNVEVLLPDYADEATVNVQHNEGETFTLIGPDGEEISGGGKGTESTVTIPDPSGGIWQVVSNSPVTVGYWWESSFEPLITCPKDDNTISLSVVPSNSDTDSYANSPEFNLEVIVNGEKQTYQLELGEEQTFIFEEESINVDADVSVAALDQPGIISTNSVNTTCTNQLTIITQPTEPLEEEVQPEEEEVIEEVIDCELEIYKDLPECEVPFEIPWWLIILLAITLFAILWYLWNKRYLKEGTFVISSDNGKEGSFRVLKKTKSAAFNINNNESFGDKVSKSSPEIYGSYEVTKGKRGSDFIIDGPTGSGNKRKYELTIGDKVQLEDGYFIEFEDGFNRKPVVNNIDPFADSNNNVITTNPDVNFDNTENNEWGSI